MGELLLVYTIVAGVIAFLVNLVFANAVASDASALRHRGTRPEFVGPATWFFATLLGGVFVATAYCAMHHSTLRRP
jgi:hypothetical protein